MADPTTDALIANIANLQRSVDKLADNIFGSPQHRKRVNREKPNTEKIAASNRDPVKEAAQQLRTEKALTELKKSIDRSFKNTEEYGQDMLLATRAFADVQKKMTLKQFEELPKKINEITSKFGVPVKTMADINKAMQARSEASLEEITQIREQILANAENLEIVAKLNERQKKLGLTEEDLIKSIEKLRDEGEQLAKETNKHSLEINKNSTSTAKWTKWIDIATTATMAFANKFIQTLIVADKYNTTVTSTGVGMTALGMSAEEFGKLQNENLQTLNTNNESLEDFNKYLIGASASLLTFTGDPKEGAKLAAQLHKQSIMMGVDTTNQQKYIAQNKKAFEDMYKIVGTTAEQFQQLTEDLNNNSDIQQAMYRLTAQQRVAANAEYLESIKYLRTQGLEQKEAESLVDDLSKIK